mgnify:CR=1 FL=1
MSRPRYAVYFLPAPETALWRAASAVIGRDAVTGIRPPFPEGAPCDAADWEALTEDPRRYGFHATLKAPFELADGTDEAGLRAAADAFAAARSPFAATLAVALLGDFVALRPRGEATAIDRLAADCVTAFEPFRAPLDAAERARRLGPTPSAARIEKVDRWGYAHVFDDFRFHMTLTGPVPAPRRDAVRDALAARLDALAETVAVDAITLAVQPSRGEPFRVLSRHPFQK